MGRRPPGERGPGKKPVRLLTSKLIEERLAARRDVLRASGIDPTPALLVAMAAYIELLFRWNQKINLTAITDLEEIISRNFAESFFGARWLGPEAGRYCDVGSGAGFPGLALKLVRPAWHATLLEPTVKKAAFLSEVGRTLGLRDLAVESARWQDSRIEPGTLNVVTARALGGYDALVEWAQSRLKSEGRLLFWVGAQDAREIKALAGWTWQTEAMPGARESVLLVGSRA